MVTVGREPCHRPLIVRRIPAPLVEMMASGESGHWNRGVHQDPRCPAVEHLSEFELRQATNPRPAGHQLRCKF